jgi:hypothetical protein
VSELDGLHPYSTEGQILLHIANTLDELNAKLQGPAPVEPADAAPATGEPEPKPASQKPPVKKAAARKRVTGQ